MNGEDQTVTVQLTFKVTDGTTPQVGASVTVSGLETVTTNDEGLVIYDYPFSNRFSSFEVFIHWLSISATVPATRH